MVIFHSYVNLPEGKHKDNPNPQHHNKNSDMTNPAANKTLRDPHAILVGGWAYPSEKSEFVSWGDYSQIYGKIIQMFQTTNQNMWWFLDSGQATVRNGKISTC